MLPVAVRKHAMGCTLVVQEGESYDEQHGTALILVWSAIDGTLVYNVVCKPSLYMENSISCHTNGATRCTCYTSQNTYR